MAKRKTHNEFISEVKNLVGDEYTVLGNYKNNKTKILFRHNCDKCNNYEFLMPPDKFLNAGNRCPKCNGKFKKTTEEFKQEVFEKVNNEYTVLGKYINCDTKIKIRHNCDKCNNHEWNITPYEFLNCGNRCPKCNGKFKKTTEEFKQEVIELTNNEFNVLGNYVNNKTKILFRHNCDKCNNHEFLMRPDCFINGQRCPYCGKLEIESRAVREIEKILKNNIKEYEKELILEDCKFINNLKFDFYFNNIYLEFDGEQHFRGWNKDDSNKKIIQLRDKAKNNYCLENNLTLIRIPFTSEKDLKIIIEKILNNDFNLESCLVIKNGIYENVPKIYNFVKDKGN